MTLRNTLAILLLAGGALATHAAQPLRSARDMRTHRTVRKPVANDPKSLYKEAMRLASDFNGVPDYKEAAKYYLKSAKMGYAPAQYELGKCYAEGRGVDRNEALASKWFQRAAEQGEEEAQIEMAKRCAAGQGVPRDIAESVRWLELQQEQHGCDADTQQILGEFYMQGNGVAQDEDAALDHFLSAMYNGSDEALDIVFDMAEKGRAKAQSALGILFCEGHRNVNIKLNPRTGIKWLRKAAAQGDQDAKKYLRRLGVQETEEK